MRGLLLNHDYGMFQAVVQGTKVETRRAGALEEVNKDPGKWRLRVEVNNGYYVFTDGKRGILYPKPKYKPGEILYLKEPWCEQGNNVIYKYWDNTPEINKSLILAERVERFGKKVVTKYLFCGREIRFKNKLFMPEARARYFVKITAVRCERLLSITETECFREGIMKENNTRFFYMHRDVKMFSRTARSAYLSLYRAVNKGTAPRNPWLFVYEFERVNKDGSPIKPKK